MLNLNEFKQYERIEQIELKQKSISSSKYHFTCFIFCIFYIFIFKFPLISTLTFHNFNSIAPETRKTIGNPIAFNNTSNLKFQFPQRNSTLSFFNYLFPFPQIISQSNTKSALIRETIQRILATGQLHEWRSSFGPASTDDSATITEYVLSYFVADHTHIHLDYLYLSYVQSRPVLQEIPKEDYQSHSRMLVASLILGAHPSKASFSNHRPTGCTPSRSNDYPNTCYEVRRELHHRISITRICVQISISFSIIIYFLYFLWMVQVIARYKLAMNR